MKEVTMVGSFTGRRHTPETLAKLRGRVVSEEARAKMRAAKLGTTRSEVAKAKTSASLTGHRHSEASLAKMRRPKGARTGPSLSVHGYVMLYAPEHPRRNRSSRMPEHVLVMEAALGRYLLPTEVVHHISHNRTDNRPENLQVLTRSSHLRLHRQHGHEENS